MNLEMPYDHWTMVSLRDKFQHCSIRIIVICDSILDSELLYYDLNGMRGWFIMIMII